MPGPRFDPSLRNKGRQDAMESPERAVQRCSCSTTYNVVLLFQSKRILGIAVTLRRGAWIFDWESIFESWWLLKSEAALQKDTVELLSTRLIPALGKLNPYLHQFIRSIWTIMCLSRLSFVVAFLSWYALPPLIKAPASKSLLMGRMAD